MADEATATTDVVDESTADNATTDTATVADPPGSEALGDPGKKALDAMKARAQAAKAEAAELKKRLDALEAKEAGREAEHAASVEAQRVKDEALAAANQRILKAEVRAAAAGKLNDPQDALRFLDLDAIEVGDDGEVDGAAVAAAIAALITEKPYLAAQGKRFQGDADGGARKEPAGVPQLTRADMARMTPEQIDEAHRKGQFADLSAGK